MVASAFGPLTTPDEAVDLLLQVARHDGQRLVREHLGELERLKGLAAGSIERAHPGPDPFRTIGRLTDLDNGRQPQDAAPWMLFYLAGTAEKPRSNEHRELDIAWSIAVEVGYHGTDRTDATRGSWWLATVVAQLLLQRTPRDGVIQRLRLTDMEPQPNPTQRLGVVQLMFEAVVCDQIAMNGPAVLSLDDLLDPTSPADPYDPQPLPDVTSATTQLVKDPLT